MADQRRIVQVLNNLFANAARHSPESSPIEFGAVRDDIEVAVSITDKGRGIPPERLPLLFRRYVDAGAHDGEDAGFGLGLVICKGLVEAHGGRIWAESAGSGLGTRFTFTLPAAEEAGASAGAPPARGTWGEAAPEGRGGCRCQPAGRDLVPVGPWRRTNRSKIYRRNRGFVR